MKGKIITCINQGSLVQVLVETEAGLRSIPMDYRCFWNMIEVKGDIKGKEIEYDDEKQSIVFKEGLGR